MNTYKYHISKKVVFLHENKIVEGIVESVTIKKDKKFQEVIEYLVNISKTQYPISCADTRTVSRLETDIFPDKETLIQSL